MRRWEGKNRMELPVCKQHSASHLYTTPYRFDYLKLIPVIESRPLGLTIQTEVQSGGSVEEYFVVWF